MTNTFALTITKVDEILFSDEAVSVYVPCVEGDATILAHHEPFISTLQAGNIVVTDKNKAEQTYEISGGVLEVSHNQATILV